MKIIFLDVDGVLNWAGTKDRVDGFIGLDPDHISRFNKIIEAHPDVKIVVSSTWRKCSPFLTAYQDFEGLKKFFAARGIKGDIIDRTPMYFSSRERGAEIREWIEDWEAKTGGKLETFVILDDDTSGMQGWNGERYVGPGADGEDIYEPVESRDLRPNHVVTSWDGYLKDGTWGPGGLQDDHIEKAIGVLNGEKIS